MNDLENKRWAEGWQIPGEPEKTSMSKAWKVIVIVLAVIGGLALIAVVGMFWMHNSMMGGVGMSCHWWPLNLINLKRFSQMTKQRRYIVFAA